MLEYRSLDDIEFFVKSDHLRFTRPCCSAMTTLVKCHTNLDGFAVRVISTSLLLQWSMQSRRHMIVRGSQSDIKTA